MKNWISSFCALHLWIVVVFCEIAFDCETLQGLCPRQEYQISCSVNTEYTYHKITIKNGKCVKKNIELDFTTPITTADMPNQCETIQDLKCGKFNATSTIQNQWKKIDMSFGATENINGATAICFGQGQTKPISKSCRITLKDNPDPPNSLSISTSLPLTISWSRPRNAKEDSSLNYIVVVNSSLGRNETLKLNKTSTSLDNAINNNITYSVCVSAQNCVGESAPICKERIVYATPNTTFPILYLNAKVLHDNKIELDWNTSSQQLSSNFCYDIEINHHVQYSCVLWNTLTLTEKDFNDALEPISRIASVYRVRINSNGVLGNWTHPICIKVHPQFSHDIVKKKPNSDSIAALVLTFKLKELLFESDCKISNVLENMTNNSVEGKLEYTFNVTVSHENEQKLKLRLETDLLKNITLEEDFSIYDGALGTKSNFLFISIFSLLALYFFS